MTFVITIREICIIIVTGLGILLLYEIFNKKITPWLIEKLTTDIEKNPEWIMSELQNKYYGFKDLDIIIVDSLLGIIPRFRLEKGSHQLQFLIPEDVSSRDIDDIAQLALAGKIKIKYGVWYPDKPTQWLSILNYLLDGGDIKIEATKWEEINNVHK